MRTSNTPCILVVGMFQTTGIYGNNKPICVWCAVYTQTYVTERAIYLISDRTTHMLTHTHSHIHRRERARGIAHIGRLWSHTSKPFELLYTGLCMSVLSGEHLLLCRVDGMLSVQWTLISGISIIKNYYFKPFGSSNRYGSLTQETAALTTENFCLFLHASNIRMIWAKISALDRHFPTQYEWMWIKSLFLWDDTKLIFLYYYMAQWIYFTYSLYDTTDRCNTSILSRLQASGGHHPTAAFQVQSKILKYKDPEQ